MGHFTHRAIIVTCDESLDNGHYNKCVDLLGAKDQYGEDCKHLITEPVYGINGFISWAILPDGSKDGWEASQHADECRENVVKLLEGSDARWAYVELYRELSSEPDTTKIIKSGNTEGIL